MNRPPWSPLGVLALTTGLAFTASLLVGPTAALALFADGDLGRLSRLIFWEIRVPRALLGLLIGGGLGLAGAALQGWLRNPLAEPGLTGSGSCAALGAVLVLYSGLAAWHPLLLPVAGIAGALVGSALIVVLAAGRVGSAGESDGLTVILGGIAVSSLATALTALALSLAPSPYAALEIAFWLLGSLANRHQDHVWLLLPFVAVGCLLLWTGRRYLDALSLGGDVAVSLGFRPQREQGRLLLGIGLTVGASTALAGSIGFVGLIAPHVLRPFCGHRPSALLLPSFLGGATLLLLADSLVRLAPHQELKLGVLTALLGAPFFLYLLYRQRGPSWN